MRLLLRHDSHAYPPSVLKVLDAGSVAEPLALASDRLKLLLDPDGVLAELP